MMKKIMALVVMCGLSSIAQAEQVQVKVLDTICGVETLQTVAASAAYTTVIPGGGEVPDRKISVPAQPAQFSHKLSCVSVLNTGKVIYPEQLVEFSSQREALQQLEKAKVEAKAAAARQARDQKTDSRYTTSRIDCKCSTSDAISCSVFIAGSRSTGGSGRETLKLVSDDSATLLLRNRDGSFYEQTARPRLIVKAVRDERGNIIQRSCRDVARSALGR